jgi:hypothetical protein
MKTVYILTNQAMPGIIKIGFTENSVEQRMRELHKAMLKFQQRFPSIPPT